jgi:class 3 adenylate cyclase
MIRRIKTFFVGAPRTKYPDSYLEELEYQSKLYAKSFGILGLVVWLRFIPIDRELHPELTMLPMLRYGFSVVSAVALILIFATKFRYKGLASLAIMGGYALIATALVAAYVNIYPYVTSYILYLALALAVPLPRSITMSLVALSMVLFLSISYFRSADFAQAFYRYSFISLSQTGLVALLFTFLGDRARFRSYQKSKEIEKKEVEANGLLLNILPENIANELKTKGLVVPAKIKSASVLFTDFVGFTRISEKLLPEEVVDELDKCFSYFDQVTEKYNLEKLKTIGDSFMCAGGVPLPNRTHAIDACLAALEIQAFMNQMKEIKATQGFEYWELRLGISSGPLVAGVVGHKKFAYDVWGDTVNTASRLESSGVPGKINISGATFELIKELFICEHRGKIHAKGKGDIDMYLLNGIRQGYSILGEGQIPNENFRQEYTKIAAGS